MWQPCWSFVCGYQHLAISRSGNPAKDKKKKNNHVFTGYFSVEGKRDRKNLEMDLFAPKEFFMAAKDVRNFVSFR